jgi:two-component system OmpR family response regulator/two-component system copper resistance phosphate regulon response regulator CusR
MVLKSGSLRLNLSTRRAEQHGREIDLTPTELSLLELLMRNAGQVVTRRMLCEHLWGFDWNGTTNVIEVHINHLRRKLDRNGDDSIIRTVRGRGYALRAD